MYKLRRERYTKLKGKAAYRFTSNNEGTGAVQLPGEEEFQREIEEHRRVEHVGEKHVELNIDTVSAEMTA